ncbi:Prolyl tripeptidyl peptidase [Nymphon striatum]|nr:Prolyl tripeptidyl peptidase [Nymphon striatum]
MRSKYERNTEGVQSFSSYEFTADESKLLLATEVESIYRHSTLGIFYVYDIASKSLTKISDQKIQEPSISPNGKEVAYVADNNLFIFNIETKQQRQVTKDGEKNKIINGITDWVYEEEFAFVRAVFDGCILVKKLYQTQNVFKYPKAGEENAKVSLHMLDVKSSEISKVALGAPYYIPRIKWMNNPNKLSVQTINRHQDHLKLHAVNAKNNAVSVLLEETDKAYVDITDNLTFLADDSFIWTSEQDGNNHIYLYSEEGPLMNQVTKGNWEVTKYYGYDQNEDRIYYQSTENGSINRGIYSVDSSGGDKKILAATAGNNTADFSTDFTYFINTHSSATTPNTYTLHNALTGKKVKDIKNNSALIEKAESGPGSQNVSNRWNGANDYWHQMLVSEGYIVACVDGRGTGFKGRDFKKVTQKELGKFEVEDQIAAARKLSELPYIDEDRTGIWGWSYGGFMSTNLPVKRE